jgi:HipA-like C-terminal domain
VFYIHQVPPGSALTTEPLGTKFKFWYRDPNLGLTLFKEGRPGTGENWAERIACELAATIDLPHAKYELAKYEDRFGVVSRSLVDRTARIIHGNELLAAQTTDYVQSENARYRNPNHTLRRVLAYLRRSSSVLGAPYGWPQSARLRSAMDFFIGYLMFDTWIANQDRHDENWALLRTSEGNLFLAPSFDHGSSMARNEPDARRLERLSTRDQPRHISTFVRSARSAFYPQAFEPTQRPLYTLDAFVQAAAQSPQAAAEWRDRLAKVDEARIRAIIDQVPGDWMTNPAKMFTAELLRLNRERILNADLI